MTRALALAAAGLGSTSPNPSVGAVVLDAAGAVVGEGRTAPAGGPHAEVAALRAAGDRAAGGTVVVTLEPCAATGRTGPCTEALLRAGVRRVCYAAADPHPRFAGGAAALTAAGVETVGGVRGTAAAALLRPWLLALRTGRAHLTWKVAASLDGRVAAADGTSRWITGGAARADVHRLRAASDAILVGTGTVLTDDPALTVRGTAEPRSPLRVVLGRRPVPASARLRSGPGYRSADGRDLAALLTDLHRHDGVVAALLEGGPTVAGAALRAGLVDRVVAYVAPVLLGAGPAALSDAGVGSLVDALRLDVEDVTVLGADVRITGTVRGAAHGG